MDDEQDEPAKIDQFGGRDILEVLKIYATIFTNNQVFERAAEEIKKLREELEKRK